MRPSQASDWDPEEVREVMTSRDFKHAHPILVKRFLRVKKDFEEDFPDLNMGVSCTYRSPEAQYELFKRGRIVPHQNEPRVTNIDGRSKKSDHNIFPSRALDVYITRHGKATWDEKVFYPIGEYCKKHNLLWGGFWKNFLDLPHIYLPEDVT